jgi:hypothetical protein
MEIMMGVHGGVVAPSNCPTVGAWCYQMCHCGFHCAQPAPIAHARQVEMAACMVPKRHAYKYN